MEQQKKFYVSLAVYAALALLAWIVMDNSAVYLPVPVGYDRHEVIYATARLSFRKLTWIVLGIFALRTWLHWHAEKIRAEREQEHQEVLS